MQIPYTLIRFGYKSVLSLEFVFNCCFSGCSGVVLEYWTCNQEVAGLSHTRSTASNLEQVTNLLCAQANSASYPQRDGK